MSTTYLDDFKKDIQELLAAPIYAKPRHAETALISALIYLQDLEQRIITLEGIIKNG